MHQALRIRGDCSRHITASARRVWPHKFGGVFYASKSCKHTQIVSHLNDFEQLWLVFKTAHFHRAADLVLDATSELRSRVVLHLACVDALSAKYMVRLDDLLSCNAWRLKIKLVVLLGLRVAI